MTAQTPAGPRVLVETMWSFENLHVTAFTWVGGAENAFPPLSITSKFVASPVSKAHGERRFPCPSLASTLCRLGGGDACLA